MEIAIHRSTVRAKLAAAREPYWRQLYRGCHVGFRKSALGNDSWIARWWDPDNRCRSYRSLGEATEQFGYEQAIKAAEEWFKQRRAGVLAGSTVENACRLYVDNRRAEKGEKAAKWAESFLKRSVYGTAFGARPLDKMTAAHVEAWRNGLVVGKTRKGRAKTAAKPPRAKNTANRIFRSFKAAMNYAYRLSMVANDRAWKVVPAFPVKDGQRQTYLTLVHRRKLLAVCPQSLADFLTGLLHTGARPDELAAAVVDDFDSRTRTLALVSHKGRTGEPRRRQVKLADSGYTFFVGLVGGRTGKAPLLTWDGEHAWQRYQWDRQIKEAIEAARTKDETEDKVPVDTVAYTMRHVAISDWLAAGIDIGTAAKRAGTSVEMIDRNYHKSILATVDDRLTKVQVI